MKAEAQVERVRGALADALRFELMQGHCYSHAHSICQRVAGKLRLHRDDVRAVAEQLEEFVVQDRWLADAEVYKAECIVAERVSALLKAPSDSRKRSVGAPPDIVFDPKQELAIDLMVKAPIGLVTGPPGSGKTTIIEQALREFHGRGTTYALAAPTGKAAIRLQETSGEMAQTIHRLLEWTYEGFARDEHNPLSVDVVIVDESSMIDIRLCADLLRAIDPRYTRIILVGDADQLPPVGPGAPFRDLIASGLIETVYLKTVHRAAKRSWIYRNAPKILAGDGVELEDCEDFEFHEMEVTDWPHLGEAALDIIKALVAEGYNHNAFQVLSPMRKNDGGTLQLNAFFQEELNPGMLGLETSRSVTLTEGDRAIHTRNNYRLAVMNGEVGKVDSIDQGGRKVVVRYPDKPEDRFIRYERPSDLAQLELAYALTVHKFQGSQIPIVIFLCHSIHKYMLSRQLLYTALTRARKRVYLIGDSGGVAHALKTIKDTQRRTQLVERLGDA